jgi:hypothetical protein
LTTTHNKSPAQEQTEQGSDQTFDTNCDEHNTDTDDEQDFDGSDSEIPDDGYRFQEDPSIDERWNQRQDDWVRHARLATHWFIKLRKHPGALAVAGILSSYAKSDSDGMRRCWPRQKTIAEQLGISEKAVRNAIAILREAKFILTPKNEGRRFQRSSRIMIDDYEPKKRATDE